MRRFTPGELNEYLCSTESKPLLLDVREPWEFEKCRITGSELLPMGQVSSRYTQLDKNRETVVICHHGIRSRAVCLFLEREGFSNVINLEGGVERWANEVEPDMQRY